MKVKSIDSQKNDATKLENKKLKESVKAMKILHQDQFKNKDARIADDNSTIKSLKSKITVLENLEARVQSKFVNFQRQSSTNNAKIGT